MKVRILLDLPKTIDGKPVGPFRKDQEVDMETKLAETFIASRMAEKILPPPPKKPVEDKAPQKEPVADKEPKKPVLGKKPD